jgi:hypothetical protein
MGAEMHIEQYEFHCDPCNYEWQMTYDVRVSEGGGEDARFLYLNGIPATSPRAGRLCPNCWAPSYSGRKLGEPALVQARR